MIHMSDKVLNPRILAHTYNPSYSGGRDQEDLSSKPALGKQFLKTLSPKTPSQKKVTGRVVPVV
jgi:hypothetical protein